MLKYPWNQEEIIMQEKNKKEWEHPGGKMVVLGADKLTDTELLAVLTQVRQLAVKINPF